MARDPEASKELETYPRLNLLAFKIETKRTLEIWALTSSVIRWLKAYIPNVNLVPSFMGGIVTVSQLDMDLVFMFPFPTDTAPQLS